MDQVRAAALNFATCIAHESHALRPAKHDFSEIVKAVVQLMAKDGRCLEHMIGFCALFFNCCFGHQYASVFMLECDVFSNAVCSAVVRAAAARGCRRLGSLQL